LYHYGIAEKTKKFLPLMGTGTPSLQSVIFFIISSLIIHILASILPQKQIY